MGAEQRRFVLWWDGQEKSAAARGDESNQYQVASQTNNATTAADLGLDRDMIHRWRKKLKAGNSRNFRKSAFSPSQSARAGAPYELSLRKDD